MEFTLNGLKSYNGEWVKTAWKFAKKDDGTWFRVGVSDELEETCKNSAAQADSVHRNQTAVRRPLSAQEIAELSNKYDPHNMSQDQYDAFLDELVEMGVLTRSDTTWLGRGGLQRLDVDVDKMFDAWSEGRLYGGTGCVISAGTSVPGLNSLEEAEGDLLRWLENMLARVSLGIDPSSREDGGQKEDALNALWSIVRRM